VPRRPRHPVADLESILQDADRKGWDVQKKATYYSIRCPCPLKHKTMVHLTPGPYYANHKRQWLKHHTCWEELESG